MNRKRTLWLIVGTIFIIGLLVSGFVLMQPSAEDILVQTLEMSKTINDAHAVIEVKVDALEMDTSAKIEIWGRKGDDSPGVFRLEVLETDEEKAECEKATAFKKKILEVKKQENN